MDLSAMGVSKFTCGDQLLVRRFWNEAWRLLMLNRKLTYIGVTVLYTFASLQKDEPSQARIGMTVQFWLYHLQKMSHNLPSSLSLMVFCFTEKNHKPNPDGDSGFGTFTDTKSTTFSEVNCYHPQYV